MITDINDIKKTVKKRKKQNLNVDESESENSVFYSSASSDELTDIEEQIENIIMHYVGKVVETVGDTEYLIGFMRCKKPAYPFIYPDVKEQSLIPVEDAIKLPPPTFVGGTAEATIK
ncbi:hypothetical protein JTB14_004404 [Gonioctena quinquepunctata]|nr:hypothetical protein JTB14_004404 [Gonioctena quinquepunctata]